MLLYIPEPHSPGQPERLLTGGSRDLGPGTRQPQTHRWSSAPWLPCVDGHEGWGTSAPWDPGGPGEDRAWGLSPGSPISTAPRCERPGWHSSGPDAPPWPGAGVSAQARVEVLAGDLRFSKLSLEDSGMYQCVAENKHGTIYASAELAVQGKRPRERGRPQGQPGGWVRNSEQQHVCIHTLTWQFSNSF